MKLYDLRCYFSVFCLIAGSAGFWAVMIVSGIRQLIDLEGGWLWVVFWGIYIFLVVFDLVYNLPRLRNVLYGEMIEEKYYSLRVAWIQIVVVSITATFIFTPFLMGVDLFVDVSCWVMAGGLFFLFLGLFCYLSFFQRSFRSRR
jgi:hypothetical protein